LSGLLGCYQILAMLSLFKRPLAGWIKKSGIFTKNCHQLKKIVNIFFGPFDFWPNPIRPIFGQKRHYLLKLENHRNLKVSASRFAQSSSGQAQTGWTFASKVCLQFAKIKISVVVSIPNNKDCLIFTYRSAQTKWI
jgi:hypothetical protein